MMRARRGRARELCHATQLVQKADEAERRQRSSRAGAPGWGRERRGESCTAGPAPPDYLLPRKLLPEPRIPRHQRVVALEPLPERPAAPQAALVGEVVHVADGDGQAVVDGRLALAEIWTRLYQRSV